MNSICSKAGTKILKLPLYNKIKLLQLVATIQEAGATAQPKWPPGSFWTLWRPRRPTSRPAAPTLRCLLRRSLRVLSVGPGAISPAPVLRRTLGASAPSLPPRAFFWPRPAQELLGRGQVVGDLPPMSPERSPRSTFLSFFTTNDKVVLPVFHQLKWGIELLLSPGLTSFTTHNARVKRVYSRSRQ